MISPSGRKYNPGRRKEERKKEESEKFTVNSGQWIVLSQRMQAARTKILFNHLSQSLNPKFFTLNIRLNV
jgi:hypothetical protein